MVKCVLFFSRWYLEGVGFFSPGYCTWLCLQNKIKKKRCCSLLEAARENVTIPPGLLDNNVLYTPDLVNEWFGILWYNAIHQKKSKSDVIVWGLARWCRAEFESPLWLHACCGVSSGSLPPQSKYMLRWVGVTKLPVGASEPRIGMVPHPLFFSLPCACSLWVRLWTPYHPEQDKRLQKTDG